MKAISLPFRLDSYGKIATSNELSKIWSDRVRTVVGTVIGERVMQPSFGCTLPQNLFDTVVVAPGYADGQLRAAFTEWLPELDFIGTAVVADDSENGSVSLEVSYQIPNYEQTTPLTYSIILG